MTGAQLRTRRPIVENAPVSICLYQPHDDIDSYQQQEPLRLTGRLVWQEADDRDFRSGIEFDPCDDAQRLQIQKCFDYFGKNSSFEKAA
jgi:methyl-accepting chemotaxis protein